jgi:hypothetical protein
MTGKIADAAVRRAGELRRRLKRHKLVFVQCGSAFSVLRDPILAEMAGTVVTAVEFAASSPRVNTIEIDGPLILTEMEGFARTGETQGVTLGRLRQRVDEHLDADIDVCLMSSAPRISYYPVPGSSLVEDAASVFYLPLLDPAECEDEMRTSPAFMLPSVGLKGCTNLDEVFREALGELGVDVLAALDYAVFEARFSRTFLEMLDPRIIQALRGAGFALANGDEINFTVSSCYSQFKEALAHVLAEVVAPQADLAAVSEGLWLIERTIRKNLREEAIIQFIDKWRKNVLHGDLAAKVLQRARSDVNVTAASIAELRDPIEWLSLGELLEVVQSNTFGGLKLDSVSWRRFTQDVVPIRNRLSHMRLIKKGDRETVVMWVRHVKKEFG